MVPDEDASLRSLLEQLASDHELLFMPTGSRHEGKPLFMFGVVPVYIDTDKKIVCAKAPGSAGFVPTSLSKLVSVATQAVS